MQPPREDGATPALTERECVDIGARLSVRGPHGTRQALERLAAALAEGCDDAAPNAELAANCGVVAPLVALFHPPPEPKEGEGAEVGGWGWEEETALGCVAALAKHGSTHASLTFVGVVDALPNLLADNDDQHPPEAEGSAGVSDGVRGLAGRLLVRLAAGSEEGVDALLRGGVGRELTALLTPVVFEGGTDEDYEAALGLLRYDASVSSGVGLPHEALPQPSVYAALLQVAVSC